jgi:hypothetical protein
MGHGEQKRRKTSRARVLRLKNREKHLHLSTNYVIKLRLKLSGG